ncbi:hypothetical protein LCGC14_0344310 [marine sediment metagenome]|uniref:Uncharacterized protein n=1 Tax=marine sediment metagenome TaxID=412755 RepID=A0A0F9TCI9_9ZZZZ
MGKKRTWRWVTREPSDPSFVEVWRLARPAPTLVFFLGGDLGWFDCKEDFSAYTSICNKEFKKLTGITVPIGRPIKVAFSAEVVE